MGRISSCEGRKGISWLSARISSGEEEEGTEILLKKIKIPKNDDGEEYQVVGIFIHPLIIFIQS